MSAVADITRRVLERCRALGFALAGVCDAAPSDHERALIEWLAAGKHGEMEYLRRNLELRLDPRAMVDGARSIICVADRYAGEMSTSQQVNKSTGAIAAGGNPRGARDDASTALGRIARYARGDDYHKVMRTRLTMLARELAQEFPDETFRACVDTAPVLEREHAQRAGLGATGKHTLLIERGVGSWLLLGEIITTLQLASSHPSEPDPCGGCTRCIDACPTKAITAWSVDATKCISYLTIEHRGLIDERYYAAIGDWIFGCDICQEVCPHNQPTARTREATVNPAYAARREGFDLLDVLHWDESARQAAFAKSALKRAKLDMMKRNALIAAGNALAHQKSAALRGRIDELADGLSESAIVRATAQAVRARARVTAPGTDTAGAGTSGNSTARSRT